MKRVLMVAEYFPPAGGVGTFRVTKFSKYLRDFFWEPVILTVRQECYRENKWMIDDSLVKDFPEGMSLYRTGLWKSRLFKDPSIRWLPPLFAGILSIIRKERPTLLYVTGPPSIPLSVAPFAKLFFRIKYVVDLRDPWKLAKPIRPIRGLKAQMIRTIDKILEPIVINNASKIICVSEDMCREYRQAYPRRSPRDFAVITNGYDPDDFDLVPALEFPDYTIVYAGKFRTDESFRDPTCFFQALKLLQQRNIQIRFKHIGEVDSQVIRKAKEIGVDEQTEFVGPLSYRDTIAYTKGADLVLIIGGGQKSEQTGKVFDYLGSKRPILALAPKRGGIADIVRDIERATLIENEDPNTIAGAIETRMTTFRDEIHEPDISKYQRRYLTSELSKILNDVAGVLLPQ